MTERTTIPCSEAVRRLWDYLDNAVSPDDHDRVERHLAFCRKCCGELEFAKELQAFLNSNAVEDIPAEVAERLARFVDELWAMTRDLMFQDEVRDSVRQAYSEISTGGGEVVARRFYSSSELAEVPDRAVEWSLGVGNPVRYAFIETGETILDIGSGGGIDTILAAKRTGPTGKAIGLDILEAMCARAREHATGAGVEGWTEFLRGEMEAIPLPGDSVDVVISNGVLNLSARKGRALAEIFRVLRPGGRICVADLTVEGDLPPEIANDPSAWAGWVSGAMAERAFATKLERAGFVDVWLGGHQSFGIDEAALYPLFSTEVIELMRRIIPPDRQDHVASGVIVKARKPWCPKSRSAKT